MDKYNIKHGVLLIIVGKLAVVYKRSKTLQVVLLLENNQPPDGKSNSSPRHWLLILIACSVGFNSLHIPKISQQKDGIPTSEFWKHGLNSPMFSKEFFKILTFNTVCVDGY